MPHPTSQKLFLIFFTDSTAVKKAHRIENSNKPCAWRDIKWSVKGYDQHRKAHKSDSTKVVMRKAFKACARKIDGETIVTEADIRKQSRSKMATVYPQRAFNGVYKCTAS